MTTTAPVAGWYPDPLDASAHRFWDGTGWTEHTTPVAEPAPSPVAVQTPVQSPAQTPVPTVAQQPPFVVPAQQTAAFVPALSTAADPYAVRPAVAHAMPARTQTLYSRRPPGPSTGVKVLIGFAIAFGCVVVIGILAAIAIPVFLNQRAHGQAAAAGSTGTTVTIPQTAAGLTLSNSPTARQLSQQWSSLPMPGDKSVGVYDDSHGRTRAAVLVSRVDLSPSEQADFLRGAKVGVDRSGSLGFRQVPPGPLGGHLQCTGIGSAKGSGTVCVFADGQVAGMIDVFGTTSGDALAVRLRAAVEQRS